MARDTTTLTRKQVSEEQLADWEWMVGGIEARYETGGFATGLELVNRIGAAAEEADHHPDLTLTWPLVHVRLVSHDAGGVTSRDVAMARRISALAADLGVTPTRDKLSRIEFGLDTADIPAAGRFWSAVLGYDVADYEAVVDPDGRQVELWFQQTDAPSGQTSAQTSAQTSDQTSDQTSEPRQRFHVDVSVPPDQAQARIDAAIAAGGTLVSTERAPAWTVLADPEGNKVCVCTWQGREPE
jgi:4a-hydroxytetrahydrobiopterin dehydratase